jgi:hypothetical protein
MMKDTTKRQAALIRISYLLPAIIACFFLFWAYLPHFFYMMEGELMDFDSLFPLMDRTFKNCRGFFNGTANGSTADLYFSYSILPIWGIALLTLILYAVFAIANLMALVLIWDPNRKPTKNINLLKKIYRMIVPNRFFYGVFCFLPVFPSLFPYFLQRFYRTIYGITATVHYSILPDFILTLILGVVCVLIFSLTKNAQNDLRMTPFKLYKVK